MYCTKCGNKMPDNAKFCTKCGANFDAEKRNDGMPSNIYPQVNENSRKSGHQKASRDRYDYEDNYDENNDESVSTVYYEDLVKDKSSSKGKTAVIVILVILVIALIGVIGFLLFKGNFFAVQNTETTVAVETTEPTTEELIKVPAVAGYDYNLALQRLSNLNLKVTYTNEYSENISKNCVIEQSPEPGTMVKEGDTVSLVVSLGSENSVTVPSVSPESTNPTSKAIANSLDYVLADSSSRYVTYEDIKNFSKDQLEIARNEIYARHGRKFKTESLQKYFNSKSWYKGTIEADDFDTSVLNKFESANAAYLSEQEDYADSHGHPDSSNKSAN